MKYRAIIHIQSLLLVLLAFGMGIAALVSHLMSDAYETTRALTSCAIGTLAIGCLGYQLTKRKAGEIDFSTNTRDGFATVAGAWLIATIFGGLPFITAANMCFSDAIFETASGLTTTGATVITDELIARNGAPLAEFIAKTHNHLSENLPIPYGVLFWRSLLNWLGGVGIVFFVLLILPLLKVGKSMQLYNAEVPGLKTDSDQITPRLGTSVIMVTCVYIILTAASTIIYKLGGMTLFDAICHAFTTVSTGGFSTKRASFGFFQSPMLQWSAILFMFVSACNFTLIIRAIFKGEFRFHKDEEFRFFLGMVTFSTIFITFLVMASCPNSIHCTGGNGTLAKHWEPYLRTVAFQVTTIVSTTGFITSDYELWNNPTALLVIMAMMFPCGCGGSTAGGMKCSRIIVVAKHLLSEIKHCVYPRTVPDVRLSGERIEQSLVAKTLAFVLLYIAIFLGVAFLLTLTEYRQPQMELRTENGELVAQAAPSEMNIKTALGASIACLSNAGPGLGKAGPTGSFGWMRPASKLLLTMTLITGRLELYTILVILLPAFWRK